MRHVQCPHPIRGQSDELASTFTRIATEGETGVVITNLPYLVTRDQLKSVIAGFGCSQFSLFLPASSRKDRVRNLGYAFVKFCDMLNTLHFAKLMEGYKFEGSVSTKQCIVSSKNDDRYVSAYVRHYASQRDEEICFAGEDAKYNDEGSSHMDSSITVGIPLPHPILANEWTATLTSIARQNDTKLMIGDVPYNFTRDDLKSVVLGLGCRFGLFRLPINFNKKKKHRNRGFAFFKFDDMFDTLYFAKQMDGHHFNDTSGKPCIVRACDSKHVSAYGMDEMDEFCGGCDETASHVEEALTQHIPSVHEHSGGYDEKASHAGIAITQHIPSFHEHCGGYGEKAWYVDEALPQHIPSFHEHCGGYGEHAWHVEEALPQQIPSFYEHRGGYDEKASHVTQHSPFPYGRALTWLNRYCFELATPSNESQASWHTRHTSNSSPCAESAIAVSNEETYFYQ